MPIATVDKVKTLIGIAYTDTAHDMQLAEIIPASQDWLCGKLNNYFHTTAYYTASTISFDKDDSTISDSAEGFDITNWVDEMDVHVQGSIANDGVFQVQERADGKLTLADFPLLEEETANQSITITRMKFPPDLVSPFARLVQYHLAGKNPAVKSFSLTDWSEEYAGEGSCPPGLMREFSQARKFVFRRRK